MADLKNATDQIFIKDLVLEMSVGIYDHERAQAQRVIVNITLDVESNFGKASLSIDDVVSYEAVANDVRALSAARHYDLLEEFAEHVAAVCLCSPLAQRVLLRIEKPDIIPDTDSVGVEIARFR